MATLCRRLLVRVLSVGYSTGSFATQLPLARTESNSNQSCLELLQRCTCVNQLKRIHANMVRNGHEQKNVTVSKLLELYALYGSIESACFAFNQVDDPNVFLWNTMIRLFTRESNGAEPVLLFNQMKREGARPDGFTFSLVLKTCAQLPADEQGKIVHGEILRSGFVSDPVVQTGLIHFYAVIGCLIDARQMFDKIPRRDLVLWSSMISGYARIRQPDEALAVFRQMQLANVKPDVITMVSVLSACADLGALDFGRWLHSYIEKHDFRFNIFVETALVDMYLKSGCIESAIEVFDKMSEKDLSAWNSMLLGLGMQGYGKEALELFEKMKMVGVKPDDITFLGILSACSHSGFVEEGWSFFNSMAKNYGIVPKVSHYGCMVDLLGRGGFLGEAQELIRKMPMEPDAGIWGALLSASRIYGNAELTESILETLIDLEPQNSRNYVLLSNVYAMSSRWDEVEKTRKKMTERGLRKTPGCSWIQVNGSMNEFFAGDQSHPLSKDIYGLLNTITGELKFQGYLGVSLLG